MLNNQNITNSGKREMPAAVRGCLDNMYRVLREAGRENRAIVNAVNFRQPENAFTAEAATPSDLCQAMLTPRQAEVVAEIQALCAGISKMSRQINTLIAVGELNVQPIFLMELPHLLGVLDQRIQSSKVAARRLGVNVEVECLPKARFAPAKQQSKAQADTTPKVQAVKPELQQQPQQKYSHYPERWK